MIQYFAGRKAMRFEEIKTQQDEAIESKIFANELIDEDCNVAHLQIKHSTFAKMGFKKSKFKLCDLSFSVFIDCYFKRAFFEQTNFRGCIFINCNFDLAAFVNCNFEYATFDNCFIPFAAMKPNLPHDKENLCADICRNLSTQCLNLGETDDYKAYLFQERAAGEIHSFRKMFHKSGTYYSKYGFLDGVEGFLDYLCSKVSKFLWGYGEQMGTLLRNMILTIFAYAYFYYSHMSDIVLDVSMWNKILAAFYLSARNFFSLSDVDIFNTVGLRFVALSEYILGLVLMGFFVAALFRQINRR